MSESESGNSGAPAVIVTDEMLRAAIKAMADHRLQYFQYGDEYVIRDMSRPGPQQEIWSGRRSEVDEDAWEERRKMEELRIGLRAALPLFTELQRLRRFHEPRPDSYACSCCGRRDGLDCVIPNDLWNQIETETGWNVLCAWCLDRECARRGWQVRALLAFGAAAISAGTDPGNDDKHWEAHLGELTRRCFEAERQSEYLQAIVDGRLKDAAEAYLKSAGPGPDGTFQFDIRAGIVPLIAAHLAASFKAAGGENYVQLEVNHEELGPLMLTMQRRFGKMPATVAAEEKARADAAEKALAEISAEAGRVTAADPSQGLSLKDELLARRFPFVTKEIDGTITEQEAERLRDIRSALDGLDLVSAELGQKISMMDAIESLERAMDEQGHGRSGQSELVRSAGLIIAEIERLDRAAARTPNGGVAP